jgi:Tol biopolymer transport system component
VTQSRRAFLTSLSAAAYGLASDKAVPSEAFRYPDPATEFPVLRITDPKNTSWLPAFYSRAVSRKGSFLLYSNDRSGSFQLYRMDLKSGQSRELTEVKTLDTASPALLPDEKSCCYVADGNVLQVNLNGGRPRVVYSIAAGFEAGGFCVNEDGQYATLIEKKPGACRLKLISVPRGTATTVIESAEEISHAEPRPRRAGILFTVSSRELHVVNFDGAQNQRLRTEPGGLGPALWSLDGRTVDYLNYPTDPKQLHNIREYTPDANEDRFLAATTQFVQMDRNSDSSVFVGSSGSKASPYVLLLVRAVKRELTLAEHKASDPTLVGPRFSPNSQRVFFQTDRHGKWAIYTMSVERLVEETE